MFKLRELERLGKKAGIVEQTVKDVLQSLVDDNMVNQDKVGSLNVFYSFPSAMMVRLKNEIKDLNQEEKVKTENIEGMEKQIENLEKTRVQNDKRRTPRRTPEENARGELQRRTPEANSKGERQEERRQRTPGGRRHAEENARRNTDMQRGTPEPRRCVVFWL